MKMRSMIPVLTLAMIMFIATGTVLADLNNGLAAHYPFDGDANDESGNGNHGTLTNMDPATIWIAGKIGQAIDFDGINDIVLVDNDSSLEPSTELTLSAWIRTPTGHWGDDNIISKDARIGSFVSNTPSNGYLLRTGFPEDEILFFAGGFKPSGPDIITVEWLHVVGTYIASTRMAIFINAAQFSERTSNVPSSIPYAGGKLGIGGPFDESFGYFNGAVDDIRIYNRSLSDFEIRDLYYMGSAVKVSLDIKPQSCPNPLNVRSKGKLPVAILGNGDFNVRDIDITTIELNGISPIKSAFEDVTAPAASIDDECFCEVLDPDSFEDLVLKFDRQEIIESLGDVQDGQEITLSLLCKLQDGVTLIRGTDCIVIEDEEEEDDEDEEFVFE